MSKKILTFIDAGVLIAAARGTGIKALTAFSVLDDPAREFASSVFVQLEVLPKAAYNKQRAEENFYKSFFTAVTHWADPADTVRDSLNVASAYGLSALDGLHITAALGLRADEMVTTEGMSKPIHRTQGIKIVSI
jgi:predicted nucleic acid-binding protein